MFNAILHEKKTLMIGSIYQERRDVVGGGCWGLLITRQFVARVLHSKIYGKGVDIRGFMVRAGDYSITIARTEKAY